MQSRLLLWHLPNQDRKWNLPTASYHPILDDSSTYPITLGFDDDENNIIIIINTNTNNDTNTSISETISAMAGWPSSLVSRQSTTGSSPFR